MSFDTELLVILHERLAHPCSDAFFGLISMRAGFALPLLALVLALLCLWYRRDGLLTFIALLIAVGCADLLGNGLKHLLVQPRPCIELRELSWMPSECAGAHRGMPSNHAINYFTVAAFLWAMFRKHRIGLFFMLVACTVGLSRIYLGRHYPSQVLVGALLGAAMGTIFAWIFSKSPSGQRLRVAAKDTSENISGHPGHH